MDLVNKTKHDDFFLPINNWLGSVVQAVILVMVPWLFTVLVFIEDIGIFWQNLKITMVLSVLAAVLGGMAYKQRQRLIAVKKLHGLIVLLPALAPLAISLRINLLLFFVNLGCFIIEAIFFYFKPSLTIFLKTYEKTYRFIGTILVFLILISGASFVWFSFVALSVVAVFLIPFVASSFK